MRRKQISRKQYDRYSSYLHARIEEYMSLVSVPFNEELCLVTFDRNVPIEKFTVLINVATNEYFLVRDYSRGGMVVLDRFVTVTGVKRLIYKLFKRFDFAKKMAGFCDITITDVFIVAGRLMRCPT